MVIDIRMLAYLPHAQNRFEYARLGAAGVIKDHPAVLFLLNLRHFSLFPYDMLLREICRGVFLQATHEIYPESVMHLISESDNVCVLVLQWILVFCRKLPRIPEKARDAEVHNAP